MKISQTGSQQIFRCERARARPVQGAAARRSGRADSFRSTKKTREPAPCPTKQDTQDAAQKSRPLDFGKFERPAVVAPSVVRHAAVQTQLERPLSALGTSGPRSVAEGLLGLQGPPGLVIGSAALWRLEIVPGAGHTASKQRAHSLAIQVGMQPS